MTYEIYRELSNGTPMWVESAGSLEEARIRVESLAIKYRSIYLIFDAQSVIDRIDHR